MLSLFFKPYCRGEILWFHTTVEYSRSYSFLPNHDTQALTDDISRINCYESFGDWDNKNTCQAQIGLLYRRMLLASPHFHGGHGYIFS